MRSQKFKLERYYYSADGGTLRLVSKTGSQFQIYNGFGDGEFRLYILRSPGWGPAMFDNKEDYLKQEKLLRKFEDIHCCIVPDLSKESDCWKVMSYDGDRDYEDEGVELTDTDYISIYRDKKGSGDILLILTNQNK